MYIQEHRPDDVKFTNRGIVLIWENESRHFARYIQISVFNVFKTPKITPTNLIPRDTLRRINKDKYQDQLGFDYSKVREERLYFEGTMQRQTSYRKEIEHSIICLKDLLDQNIHLQVLKTKDKRFLLLLVDYGEIISTNSYDELKQLFKNHVRQVPSLIHAYPPLEDLEKICEIRDDGMITFSKIHSKRWRKHSQVKKVPTDIMSAILKGIQKQNGRTTQDLSDLVHSEGGVIGLVDGRTLRLEVPTRMVAIADQIQYSHWIYSLINYDAESPYNRILILGGNCPKGFTQVNLLDTRLDLIGFMQDYTPDTYAPFLRVIENTYRLNAFAQHFMVLWESYNMGHDMTSREELTFEDLLKSLKSTQSEEKMSNVDDYIKMNVSYGLNLYNQRDVLGKSDAPILPSRAWIDVDNLNHASTIITLGFMILKYGLDGEPIDLICVNSHNMSLSMNSEKVKKLFMQLSTDSSIIYRTNTLRTAVFEDYSKLVINRVSSNDEILKNKVNEEILFQHDGPILLLPGGKSIALRLLPHEQIPARIIEEITEDISGYKQDFEEFEREVQTQEQETAEGATEPSIDRSQEDQTEETQIVEDLEVELEDMSDQESSEDTKDKSAEKKNDSEFQEVTKEETVDSPTETKKEET
ncbi:MAG: hypothetical protein ACXADH_11245, partial [Candidatus Kariarchaeaceae archaeon]